MTDHEWQGVDDDEENDEDEDAFQSDRSGRNGLLFLIDCTQGMFIKMEDSDETPFELSIRCALNVMKNKIISSDKDLIGIVFFGTEKKTGIFNHVYVYQELVQPSAESILKVDEILKSAKTKFKTDYGHSYNFSLSDAIWQCSLLFTNCKLSSSRVLLFTNQDDPHKNNQHLQRQAIQKARDQYENGTTLDLMNISKADTKFNVGKFYKDIIMLPDDEAYGNLPDASENFEELLARVRTKEYKKRTLARLPFTLAEGLKLSVGIYKLTHRLNKPTPIRLASETNEELRTMTKTFLEETAELLLPSDICHYQEFGGRKLYFTKDEVVQMKQIFNPGLALLGFKPKSRLKDYHHVRENLFIYSDEDSTTGSTRLFSALLQKCLEKDVIAICRFVPRKSSPPFCVALQPQKEELGPQKEQLKPPGFHLIYLPFAEDLRVLDLKVEGATADSEQIEKAKEIVKKLQFSYKSENFENPVLQTHWRNIEALALDLDQPEEMVDYTLPNLDAMEKRAGKLLKEFSDLVYPDGFSTSASQKRSAASGDQKSKRSKPDVTAIDIKEEIQSGKVEKLTVDVLKTFCMQVGIKVTGKKKGDLIDELKNYYT